MQGLTLVFDGSMELPLSYFKTIRLEELGRILKAHGPLFIEKDVLEIGCGNGFQMREISQVARSVVGLELPEGEYVREKDLNVVEYDGLHIPFPAASFDTVFSSNVMEHIPQQAQIHSEIHRVLRPGGKVVHVMPTRVWRMLTSALHYPRLVKSVLFRGAKGEQAKSAGNSTRPNPATRIRNILVPPRHGDLGGWFAEYWYFGVSRWAAHFRRFGWNVNAIHPIGLAYSGNCVLADSLSVRSRSMLAKVVGSSAAVFVLSAANK